MSVKPPLSTVPPEFRMARSERFPLAFDVSNEGSSPTSPAFVMTDANDGTVVTLDDEPTTNGNVVTQIVNGSALTAEHSYELALTCVINPATTITMVLSIYCAR